VPLFDQIRSWSTHFGSLHLGEIHLVCATGSEDLNCFSTTPRLPCLCTPRLFHNSAKVLLLSQMFIPDSKFSICQAHQTKRANQNVLNSGVCGLLLACQTTKPVGYCHAADCKGLGPSLASKCKVFLSLV